MCATLALAAPALLAFNLSPSATFLNQAVALVGWGGCMVAVTAWLPARSWHPPTGLIALLIALACLLAAAVAAPLWAALPWSLGLSSVGMILAALLMRRDRVITRAALIEEIYGFDDEIESNTLEAQVSRLRKKLATFGGDVEIRSMRGIGYILRLATPR